MIILTKFGKNQLKYENYKSDKRKIPDITRNGKQINGSLRLGYM